MEFTTEIKHLLLLQAVDMEIVDVNTVLDNLPKKLDSYEKAFCILEGDKNVLLDKIRILKEQEEKILATVESIAEQIKKAKDKLMIVGNQKEYSAVLKEIDSLEKMNRIHEEEKLLLYEELYLQEGILENVKLEYASASETFEMQKNHYSPHMEELEKKITDLEKKRLEYAKSISLPILSRYEFIRNRIEQPVIAAVRGNICKACNIILPPQFESNLLQIKQIYTCPSCQRILCLEDIMKKNSDK
ncbi:MAG: zinc ribbon domain-containing protein [Desulfovibrionaceae bacterium]